MSSLSSPPFKEVSKNSDEGPEGGDSQNHRFTDFISFSFPFFPYRRSKGREKLLKKNETSVRNHLFLPNAVSERCGNFTEVLDPDKEMVQSAILSPRDQMHGSFFSYHMVYTAGGFISRRHDCLSFLTRTARFWLVVQTWHPLEGCNIVTRLYHQLPS